MIPDIEFFGICPGVVSLFVSLPIPLPLAGGVGVPSKITHRVAARFILAVSLEKAGKDVAGALAKEIREAGIPVEARRFTKHYRELGHSGRQGWILPRVFDDVLHRSVAARDYVFSGATEDDQYERWGQVEEVANAILLRTGIIGRRAK